MPSSGFQRPRRSASFSKSIEVSASRRRNRLQSRSAILRRFRRGLREGTQALPENVGIQSPSAAERLGITFRCGTELLPLALIVPDPQNGGGEIVDILRLDE